MAIFKKVLVFVLILAVLALIFFGVLFYLATQDDYQGKYSAEPSADLVTTGLVAAATGKEVEVEPEQLNSFLAYLFQQKQKQQAEQTPKDFQLESLYLTLGQQEGDTGIYAPCAYRGKHLGVTARANITYDTVEKRFCVRMEQVKVGRLSLPLSWAMGFVEKRLPQGVTRQGDSLYLDMSQMELYIGELDSMLELKSFRIADGKAMVQTTGMLDAITGYLKDKLNGDQTLQDWVDDLSGKLSDFLSGLK